MTNMKKAKTIGLVFGRNEIDRNMEVNNQKTESEQEFLCLGSFNHMRIMTVPNLNGQLVNLGWYNIQQRIWRGGIGNVAMATPLGSEKKNVAVN